MPDSVTMDEVEAALQKKGVVYWALAGSPPDRHFGFWTTERNSIIMGVLFDLGMSCITSSGGRREDSPLLISFVVPDYVNKASW